MPSISLDRDRRPARTSDVRKLARQLHHSDNHPALIEVNVSAFCRDNLARRTVSLKRRQLIEIKESIERVWSCYSA